MEKVFQLDITLGNILGNLRARRLHCFGND